MNEIRKNICENLVALRKKNGMTQIDFAKKINYSDKAVSRWENGEVLPDVELLANIAQIYGVELTYFFENHSKDNTLSKDDKKKNNKRIAMSVLSVFVVYTIATILFVYLKIFYDYSFWQIFVWGVSVSCLVLMYHNKISYRNNDFLLVLRTVFVWSLLTGVYLQFLSSNLFLVFVVGVPFQLCLILSYYIKKE